GPGLDHQGPGGPARAQRLLQPGRDLEPGVAAGRVGAHRLDPHVDPPSQRPIAPTRTRMPTTFLNLENNASSSLRAAHSIGDAKLEVQASEGAKFGPTGPARASVTNATTGATAIYRLSGKSADDLTIASVIEGTTDIAMPVGSVVEMRWTKGAKVDIE